MSREDEALLRRVSEFLSGRRVELHLEAPPYQGALGAVVRDERDTCHIYVHPNLMEDTWFKVLLHECAHARLHWRYTPLTNHASKGTGNIPRGSMVRLGDAVGVDVERQAEELAESWLRLADENLWRVDADECCHDKNIARLMALERSMR